MDNLLIEARQKSASAVYNNGDWNSTLSTPVVINEGDIVEVSKTFIDTVAEADDKINIEKDITLYLQNIVYMTNFNGCGANVYDNQAVPDSTDTDGKDFIWCDRTALTDPRLKGCYAVTNLRFDKSGNTGNAGWGGGKIDVHYTDVSRKSAVVWVNVPEAFPSTSEQTVALSIIAVIDSVRAGDLHVWQTYAVDQTKFNEFGVATYTTPSQATLNPRIFSKTIDIDKGQYSPSDMLDKLNDEISINGNQGTDFTANNILSSPYLHLSSKAITPTPETVVIDITDLEHEVSFGVNARIHYSTQHDYITGQQFTIAFASVSASVTAAIVASGRLVSDYTKTFTVGSTAWNYPTPGRGEIDFDAGVSVSSDLNIDFTAETGGPYTINTDELPYDYSMFTRADGQRGLNMATNNYFIGANQISLAYDTNSSKFNWQYMHFPRYEAGGSIVSYIGEDLTPSKVDKYYHSGKSGGIAWNHLSAYERGDATKPYDFWDAKLGFDVSALCVSWTMSNVILGTGTYHMPVMTDYSDGVKTTTARPTLDALVEKATPLFLNATVTDIKSINDLTTEIYAPRVTIQNNYLAYGYFYIEVQAGLQNTIIGSDDLTRNISAIVSRYYSQGSYTSMENQNDLVYQHRGESLYLKDVRIRILNSDRELSTDIGDDNTIYISVIRGKPIKGKK